MLYKLHRITHKVPSGKFTLANLRTFVELTNRLHTDSVKQLRSDLLSGEFRCNGIDTSDPAKVDEAISQNFQIMIEFFGEDGEYVNVLNLNEIASEVDLPHRISKIRIGNCGIFQYNYENTKPSIYFEIILDFSSTRIFDLISTPSRSTSNDSQIQISGQNTTTVKGISSSLEKFFDNHKSHHALIHAENIYDLLLWLGFFPLLIVYLYKYQSKIPSAVLESPTLTQVITALTVFFILALSFRLIFNLGRWLFPYLEIRDQTSRERTVFKGIYSLCATAIVGAIAVHGMTFLWNSLVK